MIQVEQKKKRKVRLPKVGKASQLVLLIGIFAIIFIPLIMINRQQPVKQDELKGTLSNLEKIISATPVRDDELNARIDKVNAEIEVVNELYPKTDQVFNIIDILLELALIDDVTVTSIKVEEVEDTDDGSNLTSITFNMSLAGQVPKFQNYIISLNNRFPTSEIKEVNITIALEEETEDTATIIFDINSKKSS